MYFDAHADILYDVARRRLAGETRVLARRHLDRLRRGGAEGLALAVWTGGDFWGTPDPARRTEILLTQALADLAECPEFRLVRSLPEALAAREAGQLYCFLSAESLAFIGSDLSAISRLDEAGVRSAMLTWNEENLLAAGAGCDPDKGLTALGRQAVRQMESLGMLVDVSHLNRRSFWDVIGAAGGPVIASHSNCRSLCDVPRNLTDSQLRAIRDTGGVVGVNSYHGFVHRDPGLQTVETLARHALHMAEVMGPEHVGCGFDFCHFMGPGNESVRGLEDASQAEEFFRCLEREGMSPAEREGIARGNFLRIQKAE